MNPIDRILSTRIEDRRTAASDKARPTAEAIHATLGRGVGAPDLAHRLAIVVEDAGLFRSRSARIDAMAAMLYHTAECLQVEAEARRRRDA